MVTSVPKKSAASRTAPKKAVDRQFVTALARGLAVLRCFDAIRPQLGTTEIAQMTKLPQPTVWRLCHTLQQLGYLVQAPNSDKLCVGMAVLGLGQFALGSTDIGEMVLPEMTQIAKLSGAAVSLGVVEQDEILIVKRAQGDGPLLMNLAVGSRLDIATSSAGWAYLAALDLDTREETLRRLKHQYTGKWSELRAAIETAAKGLATTGFVMNEGFYHAGVSAVGAPACDKTGNPQYVLTCGGPLLKQRFMREEIGPQVARLARKITVALAGRSTRFE